MGGEVLGHECEEVAELEFAFVFPVDHLGPVLELGLGGDLVEGSHEEGEFLNGEGSTEMLTKWSLSLSKSWKASLNSAIFSSLNRSPLLSLSILFNLYNPGNFDISTAKGRQE